MSAHSQVQLRHLRGSIQLVPQNGGFMASCFHPARRMFAFRAPKKKKKKNEKQKITHLTHSALPSVGRRRLGRWPEFAARPTAGAAPRSCCRLWLKMKRSEGQTAGFGYRLPLTRVPLPLTTYHLPILWCRGNPFFQYQIHRNPLFRSTFPLFQASAPPRSSPQVTTEPSTRVAAKASVVF